MDDVTGPYNQASLTYKAGLEHDPENEDLQDGQRRALEGFGKSPVGAEEMDRVLLALNQLASS